MKQVHEVDKKAIHLAHPIDFPSLGTEVDSLSFAHFAKQHMYAVYLGNGLHMFNGDGGTIVKMYLLSKDAWLRLYEDVYYHANNGLVNIYLLRCIYDPACYVKEHGKVVKLMTWHDFTHGGKLGSGDGVVPTDANGKPIKAHTEYSLSVASSNELSPVINTVPAGDRIQMEMFDYLSILLQQRDCLDYDAVYRWAEAARRMLRELTGIKRVSTGCSRENLDETMDVYHDQFQWRFGKICRGSKFNANRFASLIDPDIRDALLDFAKSAF